MSFDVKNYLYHGLNSSVVSDNDTLLRILDSGYIYTRDSLKQYSDYEYYAKFEQKHSANWNGDNAVSVACHPNDKEFIKKYRVFEGGDEIVDDAYKGFIQGSISLVLDKSLLDEFEIKRNSWKMDYELQILGDIPIRYIKAIAINYSNRRYSSQDLYRLKRVLLEINNDRIGKYFTKYYDDVWYIMDDIFEHSLEKVFKSVSYIYEIKRLVDMYKLDIPIIDLEYGYILPDEEKQRKQIFAIQKQYSIYNQRRGKQKN